MTQVEMKQIEALTERIESLNASYALTDKKLDRVITTLLGDEFNEGEGIVHRLKKVEEKQNATDTKLLVLKSKWAGVVLVGTGIGAFLAIVYYGTSIIHNLK